MIKNGILVGVTVDGQPWTQVDDLSHFGPNDQVFTITTLNGGATLVVFGDGVNGQVPSAGSTFVATYRIGSGSSGN